MADTKPTLPPIRLLVWLLIITGVFLRIRYFDLMEFKSDEVTAILITKYWLSRGVPQFGLMSSAGILNPPGFIYLLSPLVIITSSPLWIGFYITCFNIAALWLLYRLGIKIGSSLAGFWACGFMAVHPWLILFARKIWAQSLLPFFVIAFLIVIVQCTQEPRSRKILWAGPLVSLIWQIHYSGYCVLVFFLIWFLVMVVKKRIRWSAALVGFFLGIVLLSPYLFYLTQAGFSNLYQTLWGNVGRGIPWEMNLFKLIKLFGETSFAGGFGYPFFWHQMVSISKTPLGTEKPWLQPLAIISTTLVLVFFIIGILSNKRPQKVSSTSFYVASNPVSWLVLFAVLPVFLYLVRGIKAYPHYFVVSLPAVLMLSGWGIWKLTDFFRERRRGRRYLSLLSLLMGGLVLLFGGMIWLSFINYVNRAGGTAGDYGMAYRFMKCGAERLIEERVRPDQIDARLTRNNSIGIFYLLKNQLPSKVTYLNKKARLIDSLLFPDQDCLPCEKVLTSPDLGPLKICLFPQDEEINP